jgi:hypothetical protein
VDREYGGRSVVLPAHFAGEFYPRHFAFECGRLFRKLRIQGRVVFVKRHLQELLQLLSFPQRLLPRLNDPLCRGDLPERFFCGIRIVPEIASRRYFLELGNPRLKRCDVKDTSAGFRSSSAARWPSQAQEIQP